MLVCFSQYSLPATAHPLSLPHPPKRLKEAFYNFEELAQKYGETPTLLNGQAAAHIQQGQYEDAEGVIYLADADPSVAWTPAWRLKRLEKRLG